MHIDTKIIGLDEGRKKKRIALNESRIVIHQ
jgi:hypothetical protein